MEGAAAAWEGWRAVRSTCGTSMDDHITVRGTDPVRPAGGTVFVEMLAYHRVYIRSTSYGSRLYAFWFRTKTFGPLRCQASRLFVCPSLTGGSAACFLLQAPAFTRLHELSKSRRREPGFAAFCLRHVSIQTRELRTENHGSPAVMKFENQDVAVLTTSEQDVNHAPEPLSRTTENGACRQPICFPAVAAKPKLTRLKKIQNASLQ